MRHNSRGIMYTAPPGPDEETDGTESDTTETPETAADTTPTEADANWTGTLPADD